MNRIYKYQCCHGVEYTTTMKVRSCSNCKEPIEPVAMEYSNTINIKTFIQDEFPDYNLSPTAIALFYDLIQTVMLIQGDRCIKNIIKRNKGEKTLMGKNFDWIIYDQIKDGD